MEINSHVRIWDGKTGKPESHVSSTEVISSLVPTQNMLHRTHSVMSWGTTIRTRDVVFSFSGVHGMPVVMPAVFPPLTKSSKLYGDMFPNQISRICLHYLW
jgi:hypothetical protein